MKKSTGDGSREGLEPDFATAVSSLAEGELTFPPPFDLSSSAALAANIDNGDGAVRLFDVTAQRDCQYDVQIFARMGGGHGEEVRVREVINTQVPSTPQLISLLDDLIEELHARMEE